jgi:streptogramin lyase
MSRRARRTFKRAGRRAENRGMNPTRILTALLLATAALAAAPALSAAAPTLTEYPVPKESGGPWGIAQGPDGNMWFTEKSGDAIGRITPGGTVTEFPLPTVGGTPRGIALGSDGNLWFVEQNANQIGRITPGGAIKEIPIPTKDSQPFEIAAGPDGALWFTERYADRIGRITTNGVISEFSGMKAGKPQGITAGPDGNVWFAENANPGYIARITPDGAITEWAVPTPKSGPEDITAGPDGNLWFTEYNNPGAIGRLTPSGKMAEFSTGLTLDSEPAGIAAGPDGNLWFTEFFNPGRIGRITPTGVVSEFSTGLTANNGPVRIAPGPGDTVWATANNNPAHIVRIDLGTGSGSGSGSATDGSGDSSGTNTSGDGTGSAPPAWIGDERPQLGATIVIAPGNGKVLVKEKGAGRFHPLTRADAVPVGSTVDTRGGTVRLASALAGERIQSGTFWGGLFEVRQVRSERGMTDIVLHGGRFGDCARPSGGTAVAATRPRVGASGARKVRTLWSRDRGGKFRTHGRNSVATVRGTTWLTVDRCDGTLTRVSEGKVLVRNLRSGKRVLVTRGHSYLARARHRR